MTLVVGLQSRRVSRALFLGLLPIALGLIAATLCLQFHHVADVAFACVMAPLTVRLAAQLEEWTGRPLQMLVERVGS